MAHDKPEYESRTLNQAVAHLIEEMAEATCAGAKCLRFGFQGKNPELNAIDPDEINIDWLMRELADVERAVARFKKFL